MTEAVFGRQNVFSPFTAKSPLHHYIQLTLNGLGHAILGNFSTDQIVIELT